MSEKQVFCVVKREPSASSEEEESDQPLFRPEAQNHHRANWVGTVSVDKSHTPSLVLFFIGLATLGLICVITFGKYSRQTVMSGLVVPDKGLIRVSSPIVGSATNVFVRQGQAVEKGSPLFTVTAETFSESKIGLGERTIESLKSQEDSLRKQLEVERANGQEELEMLSSRAAALRVQRDTVERRLNANKKLLMADAENLAKQEELLTRQLVTRDSIIAFRTAHMERVLSEEQITQDLQDQEIAIADAETAINRRRTELDISIGQLDRDLANIEQQRIAADARRSSVFVAPDAGQVTAVLLTPGTAVAAGVPLVSIVPTGSKLQVHLYGPSRSTGLIRPGQRVSLRFEAYPFQRYGLVKGRVSSVSGSAINPTELPLELSGLASPGVSDPLYQVVVDLEGLTGRFANKSVEIVPGMKVQANVILETRPVYRWILSPVESAVESAFQ